jgi:cobyrinic acid a,c-diamide synthase
MSNAKKKIHTHAGPSKIKSHWFHTHTFKVSRNRQVRRGIARQLGTGQLRGLDSDTVTSGYRHTLFSIINPKTKQKIIRTGFEPMRYPNTNPYHIQGKIT